MSRPSFAGTVRIGVCTAALSVALAGLNSSPATAQSGAELMRMIKMLQGQILELKKRVRKNEEAAMEGAKEGPPKVARSGKKEIELKVSGQVNRAALIYDDGNRGDVLFVDNDNSSTRLKFQGKGKLSDNWTVGTNFTVQFESNSTQAVNQDAERNQGNNNFTQRKLEFWVDHKRFGRLWLGQGSESFDGVTEKDLSGTGLAGHSDVDDNAGGLEFVRDSADELSGIDINDVYTNLDGGRDDRIRYDTPKFFGTKLSVAAIAESEYDIVAHMDNTFGSLKVKAGVGYSEINGGERDNLEKVAGSASLLHEPTGLSLTVAAGEQEDKTHEDDDTDIDDLKFGLRQARLPSKPVLVRQISVLDRLLRRR